MIYTAIVGNYDPPRSDIKCFTKPPAQAFIANVMNAKAYKVLPHLYLPDEAVTVWLDGNIFPLADEREIVRQLLGDNEMAIFRHPYRTKVWQETGECHALWKIDDVTRSEVNEAFGGLPLFECNVIVRRNTEHVRLFNEAWWSLICRYSYRDQLTFAAALSRCSGIKVGIHAGNVREHPMFRYEKRA